MIARRTVVLLCVVTSAACGRVKSASPNDGVDGSTSDVAVGEAPLDRATDVVRDGLVETSDAPAEALDAPAEALDAYGETGDAAPPFVATQSCQGFAQTFCDAFAQCASTRGVPGLFVLRYGSMQDCVAGISKLCVVGEADVFVPKAQPSLALSDVWACRAARVASCDDVLGLAAPAAACRLTPSCPVDGGVGWDVPGGRCGRCSPFPSGVSCPSDSDVCSDYGYSCRSVFGGDGGVACRKVELGGAGAACAASTDHDCLPSFVCQSNVCRPKVGPGAICGENLPCNDQLGLECLPDATVTGGQSCQTPRIVANGDACGGSPRGRCSDFSYCDGSKCVVRQSTGSCSNGENGPACLPGRVCQSYLLCDTAHLQFCE